MYSTIRHNQKTVRFCLVDDNFTINGLITISIANNDNIPGVKVAYKWGDEIFTINCKIIRIEALIKLFLVEDCDFISPQPKIVTNNGAAKPPRPAIRYANQVVCTP